MPRPILLTIGGLAAAVSNGIFGAVISAAGTLTLSGSLVTSGVATMDFARRIVAVSSAAGDTTQTLTLTGTDRFGNAQSETINLNGTTPVQSAYDYKTITKIVAAGTGYPTAGTISVGTNGVASTQWAVFDWARVPFNMSVSAHITAPSVTYTIEHTYDDPNAIQGVNGGSIFTNCNIPPVAWPDTTLHSVSADGESSYTIPIFAARITVNSGTGSVEGTFFQSGIFGA